MPRAFARGAEGKSFLRVDRSLTPGLRFPLEPNIMILKQSPGGSDGSRAGLFAACGAHAVPDWNADEKRGDGAFAPSPSRRPQDSASFKGQALHPP